MNILVRLWRFLTGWWRRNPTLITAHRVGELPATLQPGKLYVEGEGSHIWSVALLCPCGCGHALQMNMLADTHPRWQLTIHEDATTTLYPSVWRQVGCRSHFFLRRGRVEWCAAVR
ncbi:MAG: hypothetical protein JNM56_01070 [Planctomycetia bacterium]|nr:hypothetical protein [Planctomycetia bacterium]